jgi:hypothetical protein
MPAPKKPAAGPKKPAAKPAKTPPAPAYAPPGTASSHPLVDAVAGALAARTIAGRTPLPTGTADALAQAANLPDLVTFAGFLGGIVQHPRTNVDWRVLYLDWQLRTWLLVEDAEIRLAQRVTDDTVPTGERDVIWVDTDAAVGKGAGSQSVEARFLTGEFTRAGDFDDTPTGGGTIAAATGVFCEAKSVGCCYSRSRPRP